MFIDFDQKGSPKANDGSPLFPLFFHPVPQRVFWDIPWLTLESFWFYVCCFLYLFGSILALEILPLSTRICETLAKQPHTPSLEESHLTRATCETLPQALRLIDIQRKYLSLSLSLSLSLHIYIYIYILM